MSRLRLAIHSVYVVAMTNSLNADQTKARFAADTAGYGSGWHAYHNGERYSALELARFTNSGDWGSAGFARGYRAADNGLELYDETF